MGVAGEGGCELVESEAEGFDVCGDGAGVAHGGDGNNEEYAEDERGGEEVCPTAVCGLREEGLESEAGEEGGGDFGEVEEFDGCAQIVHIRERVEVFVDGGVASEGEDEAYESNSGPKEAVAQIGGVGVCSGLCCIGAAVADVGAHANEGEKEGGEAEVDGVLTVVGHHGAGLEVVRAAEGAPEGVGRAHGVVAVVAGDEKFEGVGGRKAPASGEVPALLGFLGGCLFGGVGGGLFDLGITVGHIVAEGVLDGG